MNNITIIILFLITAITLTILWKRQSKMYKKIDDIENGRRYYLTKNFLVVTKSKISNTGKTYVTLSLFYEDKLMFKYEDALKIAKEVGLDVKELSTQKVVWRYDDYFEEELNGY